MRVIEPGLSSTAVGDAELAAIHERELQALKSQLTLKDRELLAMRDQLRSIHNSEAWAVLRTLTQLRHALAPHGTYRDRLARSGVRGLRRLKKKVATLSSRNALDAQARWSTTPARPVSLPDKHSTYAVICLPTIEWSYRFQRPQQLMRQFARAGHPVFYGANHFHGGVEPHFRAIEPNLQEIFLPGDPAANVYQTLPADADTSRMAQAFESMARLCELSQAVIVAQLPYWTALAEALRERFHWPIVYDCMDEHSGFLHNTPVVLAAENRLIATSDLVIASSERLFASVRGRAHDAVLLRNACEYEHFHSATLAPNPRAPNPVIGYYGAIAEWFDGAIVAELARSRPEWKFELIGSTLAGDIRSLFDLPNVRFLGERKYADLPALIRHWDVFIIPFKRVPLTEATNPVKVYEMLATGKPVVSVALPELVALGRQGLISLADDAVEFASAIQANLTAAAAENENRRREFAQRNTWQARQQALADAIDEYIFKKMSRFDGAVDVRSAASGMSSA
jgi:hypothetical protein